MSWRNEEGGRGKDETNLRMEDKLRTIYEMLVPDADETIGIVDGCWVLVVGGDAEFRVLGRVEHLEVSFVRSSLALSRQTSRETASPLATSPRQ